MKLITVAFVAVSLAILFGWAWLFTEVGYNMSDCGVCIGGGDYDGFIEHFNQREIVARKDHKCIECRRPIARGSRCELTTGRWEGAWLADHTCLDCKNIRDGLSCGENPPALGCLWEEIGDADVFSQLTTGCLDKIETASAKAYLLQRWRAWKGLAV